MLERCFPPLSSQWAALAVKCRWKDALGGTVSESVWMVHLEAVCITFAVGERGCPVGYPQLVCSDLGPSPSAASSGLTTVRLLAVACWCSSPPGCRLETSHDE